MRYLWAAILALVLLAVWGRFGEGLTAAGNAVALAGFIAVLFVVLRRPGR